MEGEKVVGLPDLRRGMPLEGQARISLRHAGAVVDDLDRRSPCISHHHTDVACTGINGVLHQLLDDRGGALNDLASGNLVGYGIGKELNDVGHFSKGEG